MKIGPCRHSGYTYRGTYIGPNAQYRDKTALVNIDPGDNTCCVQFDDVTTGKGFGWWPTQREFWEIEDDV